MGCGGSVIDSLGPPQFRHSKEPRGELALESKTEPTRIPSCGARSCPFLAPSRPPSACHSEIQVSNSGEGGLWGVAHFAALGKGLAGRAVVGK